MDPLEQLRDLHLPPPVSFWPPAIGWWMIAAAFAVMIILSVWILWYRRTTAPRRLALKELMRLKVQFEQSQNSIELMTELSQLLRRYALLCFGRQQVAGLTGRRWLKFLDEHGSTDRFSDESSQRAWLVLPYGAGLEGVNGKEMIDLTERWIKQAPLPRKRVFA